MEKNQLVQLITEQPLVIPSLLLKHYRAIGLTDTECMLVIHVHHFITKGNSFPTPDDLADRMVLSATECSIMLRSLVQKGLIKLAQTKTNNLYTEEYSLDPLWEKCIEHIEEPLADHDQAKAESDLYTIFEKEFGRPLSPIECETLTMWLDDDQHQPQMIKGALREAVISGKLNFRYIDRILFDWKKNNVRTLEDARRHSEKVRGRFGTPPSEKEKRQPIPQMPMYNWLDQS